MTVVFGLLVVALIALWAVGVALWTWRRLDEVDTRLAIVVKQLQALLKELNG